MNEGVKIILERMKTNPEEFVPDYDGGTTKWNGIIGRYHNFLTKEESEAIVEAQRATVNEIMRERFTSAVMEELLAPKLEEQLTLNPYLTQPSATRLAGTTLGAYSNTTATATLSANGNLTTNSLTLGNQTLDEATIKHMKAHVDWMAREKQLKEKEKPKTLFGKLFNYT